MPALTISIRRKMSARILVGTASWADPEFIRDWYPEKWPAQERLSFYAERFEMVELNSSYYAVPARQQIEDWNAATPEGFIFDVKLHKALSRHVAQRNSLPRDLQKLSPGAPKSKVTLTSELESALAQRIVQTVQPLTDAGKLGTFLLQLTPSFSPKNHRLDELSHLIEVLAPNRVAVEFRNRLWVDEQHMDESLAFLREHNASFVCVDTPREKHLTIMPAVDAVTAPLAYLRLHGRNAKGYLSGKSVAERFNYNYSDEELEEVADRSHGLAREADEVHIVFNNNASDYAPVAARKLRELLGQNPGPPAELAPKLL